MEGSTLKDRIARFKRNEFAYISFFNLLRDKMNTTGLMGASDELFVAVTDSERTNFTVIDFVG